MHNKNKNKLKQLFFYLLRRLKKIDRRTATFLFFVVISIVLWFFNALSKEYTSSIDMPVQFTGISNLYKVHTPLPQKLTLQITGQGFTLLRYKIFGSSTSFKYNLNSYFTDVSDSLLSIHIATQSSRKQIEQCFSEDITVGEVIPKTIDVFFSKLSFKKVAVRFAGEINFAPQFWLKGAVKISPDSMVIGGPKQILDTLTEICTNPVVFENIKQHEIKYSTVNDLGIFQIRNPEITIKLDVEKYTETTLRLPVKMINVPEKVNVMLFPDYADIKFLISLQEYEQLDTNFFQLIADFDQINRNSNREQVKIDLISHPSTVKILNMNPKEVILVMSVKR